MSQCLQHLPATAFTPFSHHLWCPGMQAGSPRPPEAGALSSAALTVDFLFLTLGHWPDTGTQHRNRTNGPIPGLSSAEMQGPVESAQAQWTCCHVPLRARSRTHWAVRTCSTHHGVAGQGQGRGLGPAV